MEFNDLTEEQKKLALECKTPEELLDVAKKLQYKLSDEELDAISGGAKWMDKITDGCERELVG